MDLHPAVPCHLPAPQAITTREDLQFPSPVDRPTPHFLPTGPRCPHEDRLTRDTTVDPRGLYFHQVRRARPGLRRAGKFYLWFKVDRVAGGSWGAGSAETQPAASGRDQQGRLRQLLVLVSSLTAGPHLTVQTMQGFLLF